MVFIAGNGTNLSKISFVREIPFMSVQLLAELFI